MTDWKVKGQRVYYVYITWRQDAHSPFILSAEDQSFCSWSEMLSEIWRFYFKLRYSDKNSCANVVMADGSDQPLYLVPQPRMKTSLIGPLLHHLMPKVHYLALQYVVKHLWRASSRPSQWACRHTATAVAAWRSPRRGEIFMTAISSPRRHSSPFGDTHRHLATPIAMATPIAIWRHPSPFGDRRRQGETNRIGL